MARKNLSTLAAQPELETEPDELLAGVSTLSISSTDSTSDPILTPSPSKDSFGEVFPSTFLELTEETSAVDA